MRASPGGQGTRAGPPRRTVPDIGGLDRVNPNPDRPRPPTLSRRGPPVCTRTASLVLFVLALVSPFAAGLADEPKVESGFKQIFNGKNLDGWKETGGKKEALDGKTEAYKGRFKVVKGALVIDPAVRGDSYI